MQSWDPIEYVDKLMDVFAKPCIVLYRPWMPPLNASARRPNGSIQRTKLGGLPNLSECVEWPHGYDHYYAKKQIPLHFLAQIDCTELPALGRQLPASGMLYFFANTDDTADWGTHTPDDYRRVIYLDDVPADVGPRNPPPNTPEIGRKTRRRNFPDGFNDSYDPDNPLNGKIYFEWPVEIVAVDSYPQLDAIRTTPEFEKASADWDMRASQDNAFANEWGNRSGLLDAYSERRFERMRSAVYRAVEFDKGAAPPVSQEPLWRQIEALDPGAFPPNVAFVCEIVAGIQQYFGNIIESEDERSRAAAQAPTSKESGGGIVSLFKRFIGTNVAPAAKAPDKPEWLPLIRAAHTEAGNRLNALRARSYGEELTHDERAQFLAWLDGFATAPQLGVSASSATLVSIYRSLRYAFAETMFQLVRLSVTHEEIRRHFTKPMYELCVVPEERVWVQHQILGHFKSSQEARPINDTHVSLFMLSYDIFPGFRICDVGELQFFIYPEDLRSRNFGLVEAHMQGG